MILNLTVERLETGYKHTSKTGRQSESWHKRHRGFWRRTSPSVWLYKSFTWKKKNKSSHSRVLRLKARQWKKLLQKPLLLHNVWKAKSRLRWKRREDWAFLHLLSIVYDQNPWFSFLWTDSSYRAGDDNSASNGDDDNCAVIEWVSCFCYIFT